MIAIIDYKAGNLTSVRLAFESLGIEAKITGSQAEILGAERVVFPGVGAAGAAMATLNRTGLAGVIRQVVKNGTPFLGICLGAQIVLDKSEEDSACCLGLVPGEVKLFRPADRYDKVPQMGWNSIKIMKKHPVLEGIADNSEFYFVHSYYPVPSEKADIIAETEYAGVSFASVTGKGNLVSAQFHPEKSGRIGLKMLANFSKWDGKA